MRKKLIIGMTALLLCGVLFVLASCVTYDNPKNYIAQLEESGLFDNTNAQRIAQTQVYDIVMDHFNDAASGKTKKAIIIGYDGYRADAIQNVKDNDDSAIMAMKAEGGLYFSLSGGVNPGDQPTSTAPSWASMLTGKWANGTNGHGVINNGYPMTAGVKTLQTVLAETRGTVGFFATSWREHQKLTYKNEIEYAINNGLPVNYHHGMDDEDVNYAVLKQIADPTGAKAPEDDADFIFFTFEHTDHAGHTYGFSNKVDHYVEDSVIIDQWGFQLVETIRARANYDSEDWLILVTTDHGGYGLSHGGKTDAERTTWIACNKDLTSYFGK